MAAIAALTGKRKTAPKAPVAAKAPTTDSQLSALLAQHRTSFGKLEAFAVSEVKRRKITQELLADRDQLVSQLQAQDASGEQLKDRDSLIAQLQAQVAMLTQQQQQQQLPIPDTDVAAQRERADKAEASLKETQVQLAKLTKKHAKEVAGSAARATAASQRALDAMHTAASEHEASVSKILKVVRDWRELSERALEQLAGQTPASEFARFVDRNSLEFCPTVLKEQLGDFLNGVKTASAVNSELRGSAQTSIVRVQERTKETKLETAAGFMIKETLRRCVNTKQ